MYSPNRSIRNISLIGAIALVILGLSPQARAVCQEGCAGSNTFLGEDALLNNTGYDNTATGVVALGENTGGHSNTATGSSALSFNTTGSDNTATGFFALGFNKRVMAT